MRFSAIRGVIDRLLHLALEGRVAAAWPGGSVFHSLSEASSFFEGDSLGYSPTASPREFDGVELHCTRWRAEPLALERMESSESEDRARFPAGSYAFDCALLMRGIEHEWRYRRRLKCGPPGVLSAQGSCRT